MPVLLLLNMLTMLTFPGCFRICDEKENNNILLQCAGVPVNKFCLRHKGFSVHVNILPPTPPLLSPPSLGPTLQERLSAVLSCAVLRATFEEEHNVNVGHVASRCQPLKTLTDVFGEALSELAFLSFI